MRVKQGQSQQVRTVRHCQIGRQLFNIYAEEVLSKSIRKVKSPDAFFLRLDYWADRDYNVHVRKIWCVHRQMCN